MFLAKPQSRKASKVRKVFLFFFFVKKIMGILCGLCEKQIFHPSGDQPVVEKFRFYKE